MVENARAGLVVVGDDGSPAADIVWQWVTAVPWDGWTVHVVTADESDIAWGQPIVGEPWSPAWIRVATPSGADDVSYLRYACDPRAMLAERSDADLVVVGRHRRSDGADLLGSTSAWLVQNPPAPLAVISRSDRLEKVLVAADGSSHAKKALETFASLPGAAATSVTVVTVDDGRADSAAASEAASWLEGRVAAVDSMVVEGHPTGALLTVIEDTGVDMAVLGTKGLTGWKRIRMGSTAGAVASKAACNVLVASAEAG